MQGLSIRTRFDVSLSLLGMHSIESKIDFRKQRISTSLNEGLHIVEV